jgi:acyl-coenzyme A thioesterase PaaI-like protein
MRHLNPDYLNAVRALINNCPYFRLLSMDVLELSPGHALLEALVEEKHLQAFGFVDNPELPPKFL